MIQFQFASTFYFIMAETLRDKTSVFSSVAVVGLNGKDLHLLKILTTPSFLLNQLKRFLCECTRGGVSRDCAFLWGSTQRGPEVCSLGSWRYLTTSLAIRSQLRLTCSSWLPTSQAGRERLWPWVADM